MMKKDVLSAQALTALAPSFPAHKAAARVKFASNRFAAWLKRKSEIASTINELQQLDDRSLRDIGITRSEIERLARYGRGPIKRV